MTKAESYSERQRLVYCVNVAADALIDIRRIIVESDDPSDYAELANELRVAGVAVRRMDDLLSRGA